MSRPVPQPEAVTREERWGYRNLVGGTVWLTGLSGSGKSTIAAELAALLNADGFAVHVLDGDNVRLGLNADLGFAEADRYENVRRLGEVAALMAEAGLTVIVPVISPYRKGRERVRRTHEDNMLVFVEVHVATGIQTCERRDPKGLYRAARAGEIESMTGIDAPYEEPIEPEVTVSEDLTAAQAARRIAEHLRDRRR